MQIIQIKHRLLDRRLTIQRIADTCGISRTMASLILQGKRKGYKHRPKIARMLGLPERQLFGDNGKRGKAA